MIVLSPSNSGKLHLSLAFELVVKIPARVSHFWVFVVILRNFFAILADIIELDAPESSNIFISVGDKTITYNVHIDASEAEQRYDLIMGRDLLAELRLLLDFDEHVMKAETGPYAGCSAPMKSIDDIINFENADIIDDLYGPVSAFMTCPPKSSSSLSSASKS